MTREDLILIGNQANVSVAAGHDAYWSGPLLEPRLWEDLRLELQRRFRRSTGETMAVLTIDLTGSSTNVSTGTAPHPADGGENGT
jgi:hypothetical protein